METYLCLSEELVETCIDVYKMPELSRYHPKKKKIGENNHTFHKF